MRTEPAPGSPAMIASSWLAAAAAYPLALVTAAAGQGIGALAGGCDWIGISLPVSRQVWALVNQPVLNFSSLPAAGGYWLGSWLGPMLLAVGLLSLRPRERSSVGELLAIQGAWAAAAVGGAWLPLLDSHDGHLNRWVSLHELPRELVWLGPVAATMVACTAAIHLLARARRRRPGLGRVGRSSLVALHLGAPTTAWVGVAVAVRGDLPWPALVAVLLPVAAALLLAWWHAPSPQVRPLRPLSGTGPLVLMAAAALLAAAVWWTGRPLPGGRVSGVLWGPTAPFNNVRSWIEPQLLPTARPSAGADADATVSEASDDTVY